MPPSEENAESLRRLEERLDRASEAAERLAAEAAGAARRAASGAARQAASGAERLRPPPAGWQAPEDEHSAVEGREFELILQALRGFGELIPAELQARLLDALRELLMALRALIDWYLERSQRERAEPAEVQEIPIL